jgi:hypothetical protein
MPRNSWPPRWTAQHSMAQHSMARAQHEGQCSMPRDSGPPSSPWATRRSAAQHEGQWGAQHEGQWGAQHGGSPATQPSLHPLYIRSLHPLYIKWTAQQRTARSARLEVSLRAN